MEWNCKIHLSSVSDSHVKLPNYISFIWNLHSPAYIWRAMYLFCTWYMHGLQLIEFKQITFQHNLEFHYSGSVVQTRQICRHWELTNFNKPKNFRRGLMITCFCESHSTYEFVLLAARLKNAQIMICPIGIWKCWLQFRVTQH